MVSEESPYFSSTEERLQQADLLRGVRAFQLNSFNGDQPIGRVHHYDHAVVMSQDCDLEQDFKARSVVDGTGNTADKLLFSVILCGAYTEASLKAGRHRTGAAAFSGKEWKPVTQNKQPRYQYLGHVPGISDPLVVDFKDYFFVPGEFIYAELQEKRATRISNVREPWRDQILQRFGFYLIRVGLPLEFSQVAPAASPS